MKSLAGPQFEGLSTLQTKQAYGKWTKVFRPCGSEALTTKECAIFDDKTSGKIQKLMSLRKLKSCS